MDRLNHLNLGWLPLTLIAAGALGVAISAAIQCLTDRRRRT